MVDTLTPNIKLTNQEEGTNLNTWGLLADNNFERIDDKFGDVTTIDTTGGETVLVDAQEIVNAIEVDGELTAAADIIFSGRGSSWVIKNGTTGSYPLACKVSGQPGVVIPQGTQRLIYCNGTDISFANTESAAAAEATIASAGTTDILAAVTEFINITGTATITSFGTGANQKRFCRASGAFKIVHNGTSLITPTAKTIEVEVGDTFVVISDAASNARVWVYQRVSGKALESEFQIGEAMWQAASGPRTNFLRCNGLTVGSANSGATELASAEAEGIFKHLWETYSNTICPVVGGRGGSADADWAGNRQITLPDWRGRAPFGLDDMGNDAAGVITAGTPLVPGSEGGSEERTLDATHIPEITGSTSSDGEHLHSETRGSQSGGNIFAGGGYSAFLSTNAGGTTGSAGEHDHVVTAGNPSPDPVNTMPPYVLGTWYMRYK